MSRLSVAKSITRGFVQSRRLLVRCLSDDSDSSCDLQRLRDKLSRIEMDKASGQASSHVMWPHAKPMDIPNSELNDSTDDGINVSWDFKNNELVTLAGLSDDLNPYIMSTDFVEEDGHYQDIEDELQFARIRALRQQLREEVFTHEPYTEEEQSNLASVRANVDFMMQELGQIAFLLRTLYPDQANTNVSSVQNATKEEDSVMGSAYTYPQDEMASRESQAEWESPAMSTESEASVESEAELESPEMSTESEVSSESEAELESPEAMQLSSDQLTETLDVIDADDSPKSTPMKPNESDPRTDARQDTQPSTRETIPTYRPFRTIQVPDAKPTQSQLNTEEAPDQNEAAIQAEAIELDRGYTISTQLPEAESRYLMSLALKQALKDLEAGKNHYRATMLLTEEGEKHGVD